MSRLHVTQGQIDTVTAEGKDIVLKIDTGSVRLVDAVGLRVRENEKLTARIYGTNDAELLFMNKKDGIICGNDGDDSIVND